MAVSEAVARLEAKLRGGLEVYREHYHDGGLFPQLSDWYRVGHKGTCERTDGRLVVGGKPATSPATPEGAWEFVALLRINIIALSNGAWKAYNNEHKDVFGNSPIEVVTNFVTAIADGSRLD